ncbi:MAG: hypothetical protein MJZ28_05365, partial [Paludibacteraceae bacterium]|nr:hypothetical protein [Paludibacteraceae bacterium]
MRVIEKRTWRSLWGLALFSLFNVGSMEAQCVVGKTNFDSPTTLFNPSLSDDEKGWFSEDVADLLEAAGSAKATYYDDAIHAVQLGMANVISTDGGTGKSWEDFESLGNTFDAGFVGITENPKVMSPYLGEGSGSAMLLCIANTHEAPFFSYSVNGLTPGSKATMTVDLYNLLDLKQLEAALMAMNQKASAKDVIDNIKLPCNMTFQMSKMGAVLTEGSGQIYGNSAGITVATATENGGKQPATMGSVTTPATWGYGAKTTITISTTVGAEGSATFYFFRKGGANFHPIGIDNLEVTGEIEPEIRSQKRLPVCPANKVMLSLKNVYPEGTKYAWTAPGGVTGEGKSFAYEPAKANEKYMITCDVTLPGCTKQSAKFELTTKTCCSMTGDDGQEYPMAKTNIFYDDFGRFVGAAPYQYEYTDAKGKVYTEPTTGIYGAGDQKRASVTMQPGAKFNAAIKPCSASGTLNDSYAITNINPYNPGVTGDASGDPMGCMLVFDLSGSSCGGKPVKDMVVYEREVCGLCKGKEIDFSAKFGAINNQPPVGEMAVILRKDNSAGEILYEKSEKLMGGPDWIEAGTTFEITDDNVNCVVMQVVNKQAEFANSQGDYAIDDIEFTVCTPPDIAVDAELTNGTDLLDLCTDEILTLKAEISSTAKNFYGSTLGYLFQYTYTDPDVTPAEDIKWVDLGPIQTTSDFVITSPASHDAFKPLLDDPALKGLNIYFRVVIGKSGYLSDSRDEWSTMYALSPCRAISISSIPIVAALNCAACEKPVDPNIQSDDDHKVVKNAKGEKELNLCAGETANLIVDGIEPMDKTVMGVADPTSPHKYIATWHKGSKTAAGVKGTGYTNGDKTTKLSVDYDAADWYYIKLVDFDFPGADGGSCYKWDSIKVVANPAPTEK